MRFRHDVPFGGGGAGFSRFPWLAGNEGESHMQFPDSALRNTATHNPPVLRVLPIRFLA